MQGSATVHLAAPADRIWNLIADVRNIGQFSPETFEAEWLDGASGPAVGARFRGHVKRTEIGPVYNWHYRLTPSGDGTDVTESFRTNSSALTTLYNWLPHQGCG